MLILGNTIEFVLNSILILTLAYLSGGFLFLIYSALTWRK